MTQIRNSNGTMNTTNTDLCRMMDDCRMENIPVVSLNHYYPSNIAVTEQINDNIINTNKLQLQADHGRIDSIKTSSWDKHDSMHTTSRMNNCIGGDINRQWNNLESVHSMKAMSRSGWSGGEKSHSFNSSLNEQEMLQSSNSDYNDSICSFASFGDTSFSDTMDTPSVQSASKSFTRSLETGNDESNSSLQRPHSRQPTPMIRGISYRNNNFGNSLSQIQESSMD